MARRPAPAQARGPTPPRGPLAQQHPPARSLRATRQAARLLAVILLCITGSACAAASEGRQLHSRAGPSGSTPLSSGDWLPPKVDALLSRVDVPSNMAASSALTGQMLSAQKVRMRALQ
jgi:hypothetical protein